MARAHGTRVCGEYSRFLVRREHLKPFQYSATRPLAPEAGRVEKLFVQQRFSPIEQGKNVEENEVSEDVHGDGP